MSPKAQIRAPAVLGARDASLRSSQIGRSGLRRRSTLNCLVDVAPRHLQSPSAPSISASSVRHAGGVRFPEVCVAARRPREGRASPIHACTAQGSLVECRPAQIRTHEKRAVEHRCTCGRRLRRSAPSSMTPRRSGAADIHVATVGPGHERCGCIVQAENRKRAEVTSSRSIKSRCEQQGASTAPSVQAQCRAYRARMWSLRIHPHWRASRKSQRRLRRR